jgi:DHA1 family bicyclomycin/chloramphenicol resistance-like MFS transporter
VTPVPRRRAGHARLVLLLAAPSSFGPLSIDMYLPALPAMTRDLQTSAAVAQLSLTACLAGLATGQLLAGPPRGDLPSRHRGPSPPVREPADTG